MVVLYNDSTKRGWFIAHMRGCLLVCDSANHRVQALSVGFSKRTVGRSAGQYPSPCSVQGTHATHTNVVRGQPCACNLVEVLDMEDFHVVRELGTQMSGPNIARSDRLN